MKQLFASATLRLTAWYLLILACISLLFSVMVYQVSTHEIERRLINYHGTSWSIIGPTPTLEKLRHTEIDESKTVVIGILTYVNLAVLAAGGGLSYLLARRTLRPIEEMHESQAIFVSDASHELRTPLAAMRTEMEVALQDPSLKKSEMRDIITSNLEEVKRLSSLSDMLLALSSGDIKKLPQHSFDLNAAAQAVIERLDAAKGRIEFTPDKKKSRALGNPAAIEELLTILIENALKYSPASSKVTVSTKARDYRLMVRISNKGPGIAAEHLPRIFDRFYRVDTARSVHKGHGLGLALAKQIADIHRAHLNVTSNSKVTTFSFALPLSK